MTLGGRPSRWSTSCSQLLQDFLPQLLRFPKKLLILEKNSIQLQRAVRREALAQNHVAHTDWIGQQCIFAKFFEGSCRIVVVHAEIVVQSLSITCRLF